MVPLGWMGITAADSLGVVAACGAIQTYSHLQLHDLRRRGIRPVLQTVAELLAEAEAYGDAIFDLWVMPPEEQTYENQTRMAPNPVHCGSARLTIPATDDEIAAMGRLWEREIARSAGIARWADDESDTSGDN
jgi:hypothetical protein